MAFRMIFVILLFVTYAFCPKVTAEEVTVTTYYPSPYGQYKQLKATGTDADNGTVNFEAKGSEGTGLVVTNANQVGIGTMTPEAKLHVAGTAGKDGIEFPDGTLQTTAGGMTMVGGQAFSKGTNWASYDVSDADLIFLILYGANYAGVGEYWLQRKSDGWYLSGYACGGKYSGYVSLGTTHAAFRLAWTDGVFDMQMSITNKDQFKFWTYSGGTSTVSVTKFKK